MNRTRRNINLSIDSFRATLLCARASHESTQHLLQNICIRVRTLQQQLRDLQQQLNTLQTQNGIS